MMWNGSLRRVKISGTGKCVPDRVVTNQDLEKIMPTNDAWIQQRTGIKERRYIADDQAGSDLAVLAAKNALSSANRSSSDVDLLIVATLTPEHYFPGTASVVHKKLNMGTAPSMDLRCQCSGFLYALNVGQLFVASGQYERVLVVGVEVHSRGLDFTERGRDVAVLFGDGAGAVLLEPSQSPEHGIMSIHLHSEGEHYDKLWVEYPTTARSPILSAQILDEGGIYPKMDGKFVFKNAVRRFPEVITEALVANYLKPKDIDHYLFHQANLRINEYVANSMGIPENRLPSNIQKYGNCSAASIPILLDECVREDQIRKNDLVCLASFGSGFTWACAVIRW